MLSYTRNILDSLKTSIAGMRITLRNLRRPHTTVQYPEEQLTLPAGYRGIHTLDQDICIYCFQCSRICPVDCIEMDAERIEKKFLSWKQFTVDYNKCLFCDLCIEVCPKDCIHMDRREGSAKFALITDDRATLNLDLLAYRGLSEADQKNVAKVRAEAAAKAAAAQASAKEAGGAQAPPAG